MNYLLDPNIAYFLLVSGIILAILALFAPGTGLIELGALFALALAGYGMFNLPVNAWAFGVLFVSAIVLAVSLRVNPGKWILAVSIAGLISGSIFLFRLPDGSPAVNPFVAVGVSTGAAIFTWLIGRKGIEAIEKDPVHRIENVMNISGKAVTDIFYEGSVYIGGEAWSARSEKLIPAGSKVKVTGREGLILVVETMDE